MRIYTLNLSSFPNQILSNQTITILDDTNISRMKWFIAWSQFFNVDDLGKVCRVKVKLITDTQPIAGMSPSTHLGYLSASIGSSFGNSIDGAVLGTTQVLASPNDATTNYLVVDTTQSTGISANVPTTSSEFMLSFINKTGEQLIDVPDYICQIIFEIEE